MKVMRSGLVLNMLKGYYIRDTLVSFLLLKPSPGQLLYVITGFNIRVLQIIPGPNIRCGPHQVYALDLTGSGSLRIGQWNRFISVYRRDQNGHTE